MIPRRSDKLHQQDRKNNKNKNSQSFSRTHFCTTLTWANVYVRFETEMRDAVKNIYFKISPSLAKCMAMHKYVVMNASKNAIW